MDKKKITSEFIEYINKFILANYEDIKDASIEFRPNRGYGNFYRSDELYQFIFDIYANTQEHLLDLSIPETHPSPKALINTIKNFTLFLKDKDELFIDIQKKYHGEHLPFPVNTVDDIRSKIIEAFEEALRIDNLDAIFNETKKTETSKSKVKRAIKFETRDTKDPRNILKAYDFEKLSFLQILQLLKLQHVIALISIILSVLIAGYEIGKLIQRNEDVLEAINDKRIIHVKTDSLLFQKTKTKRLEKEMNNYQIELNRLRESLKSTKKQ